MRGISLAKWLGNTSSHHTACSPFIVSFPSALPSFVPSALPTHMPTLFPSPTWRHFTTNTPYVALSSNTSVKYSSTPSILPSVFPTSLPSASPSVKPTISASTTLILVASYSHTALPSNYTSSIPTLVPSHRKFQKIILFHQLLLRLHLWYTGQQGILASIHHIQEVYHQQLYNE